MTNKGKGLAALIGLGIGALAVFGYKKLPQDKKDQIKSKLDEAGNKIKETAEGVEESVSETLKNMKERFSETADDAITETKRTKEQLEKELDEVTV